MTIQEAIEKTIENGWKPTGNDYEGEMPVVISPLWISHFCLLDISWWKALMDSLGWKSDEKIRMCVGCGVALRGNEQPTMDGKHGGKNGCGSDIYEYEGQWLVEMHRFIDYLAEGKTIESYFKTL